MRRRIKDFHDYRVVMSSSFTGWRNPVKHRYLYSLSCQHRIERVNTLLKREISGLIQHELRDPRLDELSLWTDVETTQDLQHAKVFVSSLSGQQEEAKILGILNGASGFLRTALAHNRNNAPCPRSTLVWDNSIEHGDRILRLIDEVSQKDNP